MAISFDELKTLVDSVGGNILKEIEEAGEGLLLFEKYNNEIETKNSYSLHLQNNGQILQLRNGIGSANDMGIQSHGVLMAALLDHNASTKIGTWEYEIEDDNIAHTIELPLLDNNITEKQFKFIISVSEDSTIELLKIVSNIRKVEAKHSDSEGI